MCVALKEETLKVCDIESCLNKQYAKGICQKHYMRIWTSKNQEKVQGYIHKPRGREDNLKAYLKHRYGLSIQEYMSLVDEQNGKCAICYSEPVIYDRLHVDHDHETGQVRGLLCYHCNVALGHFRDNPQIVQSALDYILYSVVPSEESAG